MPRRLGRLKARRDFLRIAAMKRKHAAAGFVMQVADSPTGEPVGAHAEARRIGYTASKKVGNAVARNRAKRRLRAAADRVLALHALPGHDYVLIAREATVEADFAHICADLERGLKRLQVWRP